jgi:hypothetical protein
MGRLESLNFDFYVFNFDTMKLIFYAIMSEALIPQGFLDIEKERKLQYQGYHNFRSYVVRMGGFEPPRVAPTDFKSVVSAVPPHSRTILL